MSVTRKPRLLQIGPLTPDLEARLPEFCEIDALWKQSDRDRFLLDNGASYVGILTHAAHKCPADLIEMVPNAQCIISYGAGTDNIDLSAAARSGVQVLSTPDLNVDCVADMAMGLILSVSRNIAAYDRMSRRGGWLTGELRPLTIKVTGKRLGLLGFGRIGAAIARRSVGFDMDVRYCSRTPRAGLEMTHMPRLIDLASWCDILVVACPGGPATRHLVDSNVLDALGPSGLLINVARGSVVDEAAMIAALQRGQIAGAGLDVYADEPRIPTELLSMENVVLTPHVSGFTHETRSAMEETFMRYFQTEFGVKTPVKI